MKKFAYFLLALLLIAGCSSKKEEHKTESPKHTIEQKPKVELNRFIFHDYNGSKKIIQIQNEEFVIPQSKEMVLILFFATWCPSCQAEIPEIIDIQKKFKDKLDIIGIPLDDTNLQNFIQKEKITFFVSKDIQTNNRFAKKAYEMLHAGANMPIPLTLLLKNGKYEMHYIGAVPYEVLQSDIQKALGE